MTKKLKQKGIFEKFKQEKIACADFDEEGWCYSGNEDGSVYVWSDACKVVKSLKVHAKEITCLASAGGKILTGAKDNKVGIITAAGGNFKLEKFVEIATMPKSLDFLNGNLLAGLRNGMIQEFVGVLDSENVEPRTLMKAHFDGETWGLELVDDEGKQFITCGDDNKFMLFDAEKKTCERQGKISEKRTMTKKDMTNTASTTGRIFREPNRQSRAVAYSKKHNQVAVSNNWGKVSIRKFDDFDAKVCSMKDAKEWNEVLRYSPCEKFLAVGSHDNHVYVYSISEDGSEYKLHCKFTKNNSFITGLDWSLDSNVIRTMSGSHEKLYHSVEEKAFVSSGMSDFKDKEWATQTMRTGWDTQGIYPSGEDGTHINGVWKTTDGTMLLSGDDFGLLNVYNYPVCDNTHEARSYSAHSEHVVRTVSNKDASRLYSVGGNDKTIIQWKRK